MNIFKYLILVIIFICSYLVFTKLPIFGKSFGKYFTLIKDVALFGIIIGFVLIKIQRPGLKIDKINAFAVLYLIVLLFYTAISPLGKKAIIGFLGFGTAPILFLLIYNIKIKENDILLISKVIFYFILLNVIFGLLIFLFCFDQFKEFLGVHEYLEKSMIGINNIYRVHPGRKIIPRLIGLSISPNETAGLCVFLIIFASSHISKKGFRYLIYLIIIITLYLTTQRSPVLGIVGAILLLKWTKFSKVNKLFSLTILVTSLWLIITFILSNIEFIILNIDASIAAHTLHLFVDSPEVIMRSWYGLGIGMAGGLTRGLSLTKSSLEGFWFESEYIMMIIQIGVIGFAIYIFLVFNILSNLFSIQRNSKNIVVKIFSKNSFLFFLAIWIGGITFPLFASSRLISFLVWMYSAFAIHLRSLECKKEENEYKSIQISSKPTLC